MNFSISDINSLVRVGGPALGVTTLLVLLALWRKVLWVGTIVDYVLQQKDREIVELRQERDQALLLLQEKGAQNERDLRELRGRVEGHLGAKR